MQNVIQVHTLRKAYAGVKAVDGLDFEVRSGEIFAMLVVVHTGSPRDISGAIDRNAAGLEHGAMRDVIPAELLSRAAAKGVRYDPTLVVADSIFRMSRKDLSMLEDPLARQTVPARMLTAFRSWLEIQFSAVIALFTRTPGPSRGFGMISTLLYKALIAGISAPRGNAMKNLWMPRAMRVAPPLDPSIRPGAVTPKHALLLNPFYPKDPHASFGKHVLTPTLALTSVAAGTPSEWSVACWDENLLQGPPPWRPFPQVVGITVHLTFAQRAFELARWYRERGALVILGGLHVLSCPEECEPHADALALGEGVQLWGRILRDIDAGALKRRYEGSYRLSYRDDPAPRRDLLPRGQYLTTASLIATRGCHNRCEFCYLSTEGLHMPYMLRDVEQIVGEFNAAGQPYAVFTDNNLGSRPEYLRKLCRALRPLEKIWSAAVTIDVTDDPDLVREMALAGCTGVFIGFESLHPANIYRCRQEEPAP